MKGSIDPLELWVIFLSPGLTGLLEEKHVVIHTENMMIKAYIYHQGDNKLQSLNSEATQLLNWAENPLASIKSAHMFSTMWWPMG